MQLFNGRFAVVSIVALTLSLSLPASAIVTVEVVASSAPNASSGSPSWTGYLANALNSLEHNLGNIGSRATDPTAYEIAGPTVQPGDLMVSTFKSWRGVINPAAPFNNEYGNRMHFGLHATGDGTTQFRLEDLTFAVHSSDADDSLVFTGDFIGYGYSVTRYGISWGGDRIKGTADDVVYTSGNGKTLVDEIVYVGVGNAFWPGGADPTPGNPVGGAQAAMDDTIDYIFANAPFTVTGSYAILGYEGSDMVTVPVPEPATMLAGTLLLLPLGVSTIRMLRKGRKP